MPSWNPGDSINIDYLNTGYNFAGNGGNGTNNGDLYDNDHATFSTFNYAEGADIMAHAGDYVWAIADWDAGGGGAGTGTGGTDGGTGTGTGGYAESNGDQVLTTGGNTTTVDAATTATQTNTAMFNQGAVQMAGIGGAGGNDNAATGGTVMFALPDTHTFTLGDITVGDITLDGLLTDLLA